MIRGRKRPLLKSVRAIEPEAQRIKANLNCSIHNRFDIEVVDVATGRVKERAYGENTICAALWTRLFTPATYFNYIFYGTGSGTPASTDTSLFTHLGYGAPSTSEDAYTYAWTEGYISLTRKIQLSETTVVGSTLTEVGIGYGTSSSNLCTHAMLKDMNGNAVSIAKMATDIINIYATVFVHWETAGYSSGAKLVLGKQNSFLLSYLTGMSASTGFSSLVFQEGGAPGSVISYGAYTGSCTFTYSSSNKQITCTAARLAVANGNFTGGIHSVNIGVGSNTMIRIPVGGSWFTGTDIVGEAIGTGDGSTANFATDFSFVKSGAKIYIDGFEQTSGVTVDVGTPLDVTEMERYFIMMPWVLNNPSSSETARISARISRFIQKRPLP